MGPSWLFWLLFLLFFPVKVARPEQQRRSINIAWATCPANLENVMRLQQSVPSIAAYKRALRAKLGLRGAALERAARVAAKYGNTNAVLRAAAGF